MSLSLKTTTIILAGLGAAAFGVAGAAEKAPTMSPERPGMVQTVKETAKDAVTMPAPRLVPPANPVDVAEFAPVKEMRPVHFAFDRATLRREDLPVVDAHVEWLRMHPTEKLLVQGFADERGDARYNLALAERRAQALRDALIVRGVPSTRFVTASFGEARPACRAHTDPCWRESRTAVIFVEPTRPQSP